MENPEFVNLYMEKLLKEIEELVKYKLLIETKLTYVEKGNQVLVQKIEELQAQIDKQQKKAGKSKDAPAEVENTVTF